MWFSAFCRFGNGIDFSSRRPHGERIYRDMVRNLGSGKNYTEDFDSLAMARVFANAMLFARVLYTVQRAGSQFQPKKALELLPVLEREYGIDPEPTDTIKDRQKTLSAYARIPRGAKRENVTKVMDELLGSDFTAYLTVEKTSAVCVPGNPLATGVYIRPGSLRSVFQLTSPVSTIGTPVIVGFKAIVGAETRPTPGDKFVIDTGDWGRVEAATVISSTSNQFTAIFTSPHNQGVYFSTGLCPVRVTSKRHNLFVISNLAAENQRLRRKANRTARRLLRGISTWDLTDGSGPFKVGEGKLDVTILGVIDGTYVSSSGDTYIDNSGSPLSSEFST